MSVDYPHSRSRANYFMYKTGSICKAKAPLDLGYSDFSASSERDVLVNVLTELSEGGIVDVAQQHFNLQGDDIILPSKNYFKIRGQGLPRSTWVDTWDTTGGSVIDLNGIRLRDGEDSLSYKLKLENLLLNVRGTYTDHPINLPYGLLQMDRVKVRLACTLPNGIEYYGMNLGAAGPSGAVVRWKDCGIHDCRTGGLDNYAVKWQYEGGVIDGMTWVADIGAAISENARMMLIQPVSFFELKNFLIYISGAMKGPPKRLYKRQFAYTGTANKTWIFKNVQFLDPTHIAEANITVGSGGVLHLQIETNSGQEGGSSPVDFSKAGSGTLKIYGSGRGFENSGSSTGTGAQQTIAHGLVRKPELVMLSNIEDGANPYESAVADGTNIYITAVSGKDYRWYARVME